LCSEQVSSIDRHHQVELEAATVKAPSTSLNNVQARLVPLGPLEDSRRADLILPIAALDDSEEGQARAYSPFEGETTRDKLHSYSSVDYATYSVSSD